jgi:hypothetical protein
MRLILAIFPEFPGGLLEHDSQLIWGELIEPTLNRKPAKLPLCLLPFRPFFFRLIPLELGDVFA